jgi:putative DNA primase/helicase
VLKSLRILDITDRRALERDVLKTILVNESFRRTCVLESLSQSDFETPEFRGLFGEIQSSCLTRREIEFSDETMQEVLSDGIELMKIWGAAIERLKRHQFDPLMHEASDLGNAERFETLHGYKTRYDHTAKQWLLWDGTKWVYDTKGEVVELIAESLRSIYMDAASLSTEEQRSKMARWAIASERRTRISDALILAQSLPGIRTKSTDFDANPWQMNLQNGILDLRGGTMLPHDPRDLCSKIGGTSYDGNAKAPWWDDFLKVIFDGDSELINFVQRAVGYCLTGVTDAQALFFAYGSGANGKSTFFEILRLLFGDYYQKAPSELLLMKRSEGVPADVARLCGVRLAVLAEIAGGKKLNEAKAKDLSGNDTVVARHLYGSFFEFAPTHKIWMYGNHKPVITGTDHGIWRRLLLIPFTVTIQEDKRKPMRELLASAQREMPGILNWCLEGLEGWKRFGLDVPAAVRTATDGYREESDLIQEFLDECCERQGEICTVELFERFQSWAGKSTMSQRMFLQAVKAKGYPVRIGSYKRRYFVGISIPSGTDGISGA